MKKVFVVFLLLIMAFAIGTVLAMPTNFVAHLSGAGEVPPVETQAQGQVKFQLRGEALNFKLIAANIDNVTQAHIHCGPADANGPVVAFLFGFVAGGVDVNGILSQGSITAADVIARPDSAVCPGGVADFADLIEQMESGNTYVNVHTVANPPGEIRGQIRLAGRPR